MKVVPEELCKFAVARDTLASSDWEANQFRMLGCSDVQIKCARLMVERFRPDRGESAGHLILVHLVLAAGTWFVDRYLGDVIISAVRVTTIAPPMRTTLALHRGRAGC